MGLPDNSSRSRRDSGTAATRSPFKLGVGLAVVACLLGVGLLLAAAAGFAPPLPIFGDGNGEEVTPSSESKAGADTTSVVGQLPPSSLQLPKKEAADPRYAFLLLGYGGGGHEGAYLSDSMMVIIVDPAQKTMTMLSLPRDIWAPLIFDGKTAVYNKLNTAYAFARDSSLYKGRIERYTGKNGAGRFAVDTVSRLLGIPIANYLALDFQGFRDMIDAVGGIDVEVPASFSARYPANDDPTIDSSWITVRFTKGQEHMSGERAIRFARAREALDNVAEGNDFARSRRQRLIMEAFKNKLLSPVGLINVPRLLSIASGHVDTDYALPDAPQIGKLALEWRDTRIYQTALTLGNYLDEATGPGGAYILVPNEPEQSWERVRAFARRLWQDPAAGLAMADTKVTVENDSGVNGVAANVTEALAKMGYRVNEPLTGTVRPDSRLIDRSGGSGKTLVAQLERDLGHKLTLVAGSPTTPGDVVLAVGAADADLADLRVAEDSTAPLSAAGLVAVGVWRPLAPPAAQTPARAASATVAAVPSPLTPGPTLSPTKPLTVTTPQPTPTYPVSTPTPSRTPLLVSTPTPPPTPKKTQPAIPTPTRTPRR